MDNQQMDLQYYSVFGNSAKNYGLYHQEVDGKLILDNSYYG
jgi:hypothetical protein